MRIDLPAVPSTLEERTMRSNIRTLFSALALSTGVAITASGQLIGTGTGGNIFPFGGTVGTLGTVYQQVYASFNFGFGPVLISEIDFFLSDCCGTLNTGTFNIFLSTTSAPVDGLNTTNFDANRGANNTLFGSFALGGIAPLTLAFTGPAFFYNPAAGNLLVDVRSSITSSGSAGFKANNGDAGGVYSRAHDFGTGFAGYGLQTRFISTVITPEPASILLVATGLAGIAVLCRRRRRIGGLESP